MTIADTPITDILEMSIQDATQFYLQLELPEREAFIAQELLKEIRGRLRFLMDVGLGYLTLARPAPTLSGGRSAADPSRQSGGRGATRCYLRSR